MATVTTTISISREPSSSHGSKARSTSQITAGPDYPGPEWSHTTLNYYRDSTAPPPDTLNSQLTEHEIRLTRRSDDSPHIAPTPVSIRNIRGHEDDYTIEKQGFTIGHLESQMPAAAETWRDDELLKRVYFPEVDALLKRELGCSHTFQYEWHVRTSTLEDALTHSSAGKVDINGPVRRVHIDESPASARKEFAHYHPELAGRKFGIFNVWKPLKTVRKDPLCLCDERTVKDEELQSGKVTVPHVGEIENFAVRPPRLGREGKHGFAYVRGMRAEEAYVFRIYDGRVDDVEEGVREGKRSHGVAHTSFVDPGTEDEEPRESVEVRSFCVL